jgi:hypothetical protein
LASGSQAGIDAALQFQQLFNRNLSTEIVANDLGTLAQVDSITYRHRCKSERLEGPQIV